MEEENFDKDWLNERYPFDVEARNKELQTKVLQHLEGKEKLVLVDVGSGTGSNCLYFVEKLLQNQKWYLIEQNEYLSNATIRRLKEYASYHKYEFERKKKSIKITAITKTIEVVLINDSMLNLDALLDVTKIDLLTANAVFDLLSEEQIEQFSNIIINNKIPFYATLNYQNMTFFPEDPFDDIFISIYNNHMERRQVFGKAMGKNAPQFILAIFEKENWLIDSLSSNWNVERDDIKMHYYLLNFMENALAEMNLDDAMQSNFQKWLQRKKGFNHY